MKRILWCVLAILICAGPADAAPAARIDIVIPTDNAAQRELSGKIQASLQQQAEVVVTVRTRAEVEAGQAAPAALVIGVGDALLPWLASTRDKYPAAIAFYVNSSQFRDKTKGAGIAALYRDQPLTRQLRLARLLFPKLRRVAILQGEQALPIDAPQLQRATGLAIAVASIRGQPEWTKSLSQLLSGNDILLGVDDPQMYNSNTIHSILLTAYRHGKVLIGPGKSFVTAGGLASCYTSTDDYVQQLADMVRSYLQTERLPESQYPRHYEIAINQQVATSLGLTLPDEKSLVTRLRNSAEECGNDC